MAYILANKVGVQLYMLSCDQYTSMTPQANIYFQTSSHITCCIWKYP